MFNVNDRNTKTRCEIYSKLTIKTSERRQWRRSSVFIVNLEHFTPSSSVSNVNFEQANAGWVTIRLCSTHSWLIFLFPWKNQEYKMGRLFTNGLIWNKALVLVKLTLSWGRFLSYRNQSTDLLFILPLYTSIP